VVFEAKTKAEATILFVLWLFSRSKKVFAVKLIARLIVQRILDASKLAVFVFNSLLSKQSVFSYSKLGKMT